MNMSNVAIAILAGVLLSLQAYGLTRWKDANARILDLEQRVTSLTQLVSELRSLPAPPPTPSYQAQMDTSGALGGDESPGPRARSEGRLEPRGEGMGRPGRGQEGGHPSGDPPSPQGGPQGRGEAKAQIQQEIQSLVAGFAAKKGWSAEVSQQASALLQEMAQARAKANREARQSGQTPGGGRGGQGPAISSAEEEARARLNQLVGDAAARELVQARMEQVRSQRAQRMGGAQGGQ